MVSSHLIELLTFLPGILYLGLVTSYTDIREGKIKNKNVIFALVYSVIAYSVLMLFYSLGGVSIRLGYFYELVSNGAIALSLGFLFWHFRLWSAADAKLFFAFSLIVPLTSYKLGHISYFPSFIILLNTFIPFALYIMPKIIFFMPLKEKKRKLKQFKLSAFLNMILVFFAVSWMTNLLSMYFKINLNMFFSLVVIYIFLFTSKLVFKKFLTFFLVFLAVLRILVDSKNIMTSGFMNSFIILSIFILLIFLLSVLSTDIFIKETKISELKRGMIAADIIYFDKKSKAYRRANVFSIQQMQQRIKQLSGKAILTLGRYAEGLTERDLKKIKGLFKKRKFKFSKINIQQTLPFAPFLFAGVLITLASQGNFVIFLINFIVKFINMM